MANSTMEINVTVNEESIREAARKAAEIYLEEMKKVFFGAVSPVVQVPDTPKATQVSDRVGDIWTEKENDLWSIFWAGGESAEWRDFTYERLDEELGPLWKVVD